MTAMLDQAAADPQQIIVELQRQLDERTAELQEKNERYALVSQAVAEGIYDWDIAANALWVSPRLIEIFGLTGESLSAADWNARVHPDDFEHYRTALRDCFKAVTARLHCEYRIQLTNGEYRWVEDHGLPTRDGTGRAIRLVGAVSDITERKEAEHALREALEQQTATAQILEVINRSPGNLAPVFEAMVERAVQLCEADEAAVRSFDGKLLHLVAAHGDPDALEKLRELGPSDLSRPGQPAGLYDPFTRGERVVHIADVRETEAFRKSPIARKRLQLRNIRTWLAVALSREGTLLGVINVHRHEVRLFSEKQIALLENFAAQAVIALENARLLGELQQRTGDLQESLEYQTATSDVLKVISGSSFDVQPVFETILETAARLCDADAGIITTREGEAYRCVATLSQTPEAEALYLGRLFPVDRGSTVGRTALEGQVIHVADIASDPEYTLTETVTLGKFRTALGVPLLREGGVVGVISLGRQRVQPFADRQIELVRTFADQAVIAIENTRLLTELRESLEQQTATAEVLQVINSSPGELQPVFGTMLEKAMRLCEAAFGLMRTYDGHAVRLVASRGLPPRFAEFAANPANQPGADREGGAMPHFLAGAHFVHTPDLKEEEAYRSGDPYRVALVEIGGARTMLVVPLRKDGAFLGQIAIYRQEVRPYSDKQIALLQNFAAQAVIAMENARLLGELQTRTRDLQESLEYQTATSDVLKVISGSSFDIQPVFDTIVATAARLCGSDAASISMRKGEGYRYVARSRLDDEHWAALSQRTTVPGRQSLVGRVALEGGVVQIADIAADPDFAVSESVAAGTRTVLGVPLLREGAVVGTINMIRRRVEPFTERQIELVRTFADQAVIAIENARLLTELRKSLEQQTATAEVLQVINSSPGELQPVFEAILEKAHTHCGATRGTLFLFDGETFRGVAMHGFPQDLAEQLRRGFTVHEVSVVEPLLAGAPFVHIADLRLIEEPVPRAAAERGGVRTCLLLALRKDGALLGHISCSRDEVRPFSEKEIAFLENFAAQAVIAMDNARLLGELRERTRDLEESLEYQTATSDVLNVISRSTADVQPVLDTVTETAARLCGADSGTIYIREGEVYRAVSSSYSASDPEYWAKVRQRTLVPGRDSMTGRVAVEGRVVHTTDILADPDFAHPEAIASGRRTMLGVPLLREGAVLGTIALSRKRVEPFTERQIELVRTFADQAVIAIENARC